ncbi:MAG: hypothetical protein JXR84_11795 [Anaerolineae bacterium]|nr:hypothetical protein [Anaerolineae bacterium]
MLPKQNRLDDGPGSLTRLLFGVHRLTGRRYPFCAANGTPLAPTLREQLRVLSALETVP